MRVSVSAFEVEGRVGQPGAEGEEGGAREVAVGAPRGLRVCVCMCVSE